MVHLRSELDEVLLVWNCDTKFEVEELESQQTVK